MIKEALGWSALPKAVRVGFMKAVAGETPLLLKPFAWAAGKFIDPKKIDRLYWRAVQKPIAKADMFLGDVARKSVQKASFGKLKGSSFEGNLLLPMKKARGLSTGNVEYKLPSLLAPAKSVGKFVFPMLGVMKAEEWIEERNKNMSNKPIVKVADLKKTAEMLIQLKDQKNTLEKKAHATKLLYKQAELGQIKFPTTFAEYQEKVAELLGKNLNVVEEAIGLATSNDSNTLGGLGTSSSFSDPRAAFQRSILDN